MEDDYLIEYEDISDSTIEDLLNRIDATRGKRLEDLKIKDLTYHNATEIWPGEGIYLFRDHKKNLYVGEVRSMSFTERIAKHFDFRHFAWMNRLLELICVKVLELDWNDDNAKKASIYAFDNLNLVLVNFTERYFIDKTERLLRSCTCPLNAFKNLKETNVKMKLKEYYKHC